MQISAFLNNSSFNLKYFNFIFSEKASAFEEVFNFTKTVQ
jgi:hypothetical protein